MCFVVLRKCMSDNDGGNGAAKKLRFQTPRDRRLRVQRLVIRRCHQILPSPPNFGQTEFDGCMNSLSPDRTTPLPLRTGHSRRNRPMSVYAKMTSSMNIRDTTANPNPNIYCPRCSIIGLESSIDAHIPVSIGMRTSEGHSPRNGSLQSHNATRLTRSLLTHRPHQSVNGYISRASQQTITHSWDGAGWPSSRPNRDR